MNGEIDQNNELKITSAKKKKNEFYKNKFVDNFLNQCQNFVSF